MSVKRPLAVLTGPTGPGKTDIALALARQFPIEIVSVDSAQVYRGLDIGSAKPSRQLREQVPHHLVDLVDAGTGYSAGQFVRDAARAIEDIEARGRVPLLVGGTMLYLRALTGGIATLPEGDAGVRARLDAEATAHGWPFLHARLAGVDPEAAARIHPVCASAAGLRRPITAQSQPRGRCVNSWPCPHDGRRGTAGADGRTARRSAEICARPVRDRSRRIPGRIAGVIR